MLFRFRLFKVTGWAKGVITALLYREDNWPPGVFAPYQIRLEEQGTLIFAPKDIDEVIRLDPDAMESTEAMDNTTGM